MEVLLQSLNEMCQELEAECSFEENLIWGLEEILDEVEIGEHGLGTVEEDKELERILNMVRVEPKVSKEGVKRVLSSAQTLNKAELSTLAEGPSTQTLAISSLKEISRAYYDLWRSPGDDEDEAALALALKAVLSPLSFSLLATLGSSSQILAPLIMEGPATDCVDEYVRSVLFPSFSSSQSKDRFLLSLLNKKEELDVDNVSMDWMMTHLVFSSLLFLVLRCVCVCVFFSCCLPPLSFPLLPPSSSKHLVASSSGDILVLVDQHDCYSCFLVISYLHRHHLLHHHHLSFG